MAASYQEIGQYWDEKDLDEIWDQTEPAEFSVSLQSQVNYYPIDSALSDKIRDLAKHHGVSPQTLLNQWVQVQIQKEQSG
jgi:hypothetical protein